MLSKILGKKEKNQTGVDIAKISRMNLTELRSYLNNKIESLPVTQDGLVAVMKKLATADEVTKKYYIEASDTDQKKKKAFDVFLLLAKSKKMSVECVELMQLFVSVYEDIVNEYDTKYKEIYRSRLGTAIEQALVNIHELKEFDNKMKVLGE